MMQKLLVGALALVAADLTANAAWADGPSSYYAPRPRPPARSYPPAPPPSYPAPPPMPPSPPPSVDCLCTRPVVFYGASSGYGDISVAAPGVRVYGEPVVIPSGRIDIQGPPVYVDAPPVRVAAPQIYLHRPEVYVRPSAVTVEAPEIHFTGCAEGARCEPAPRR